MALPTVTKKKIVTALDELPPEQLVELDNYIAYLRFKAAKKKPRLIRLGGLWKDLPPLTEEAITEVRQEIWGTNCGNQGSYT
jgi:hypothetical protein